MKIPHEKKVALLNIRLKLLSAYIAYSAYTTYYAFTGYTDYTTSEKKVVDTPDTAPNTRAPVVLK